MASAPFHNFCKNERFPCQKQGFTKKIILLLLNKGRKIAKQSKHMKIYQLVMVMYIKMARFSV